MTVQVIYLNGCWEYIRGVKSIVQEPHQYRLELLNGSVIRFDDRMTLKVTMY